MKPQHKPGDIVYVTGGHPAFRFAEQAVVTSFSQGDADTPRLYRVKDVEARWHWLEGWQLSSQPPRDETGEWETLGRTYQFRPAPGAAKTTDSTTSRPR